MINMFRKTRHIYFIGIGGIGMSGMAELLHKLNFDISGSDINYSERTEKLAKLGITVYKKHSRNQVIGSDVVVFSSAVDLDNPEIQMAKKIGIPVIRRAEMLAELLKVKNTSIAVAGTHGKTTTSSILGSILTEAQLDPTLVIGGIVNKFKTNAISGNGDLIVVEADEFDRSFLLLQPTLSIITNLDLEHLDCYKNMDDLKTAFSQFANSSPFYGLISICIDCPNLYDLAKKINKPIITYGLSQKANYRAINVKFENNSSNFDLMVNETIVANITNKIPGNHNICNALGAISIAAEMEIPFKTIKKGIEAYKGVRRRFEIKYKTKNNIMIIDDYAHHPSEVRATIEAAKNGWGRNIIVVFQPHLFSRTRDFFKEFAESFLEANTILITNIYPGREKPVIGINSKLIFEELKRLGHSSVYEITNIIELPSMIKKISNDNDLVITMGAGDIWRQCKPIYEELNK